MQPTLPIEISSRWCSELSQLCHTGPKAVHDAGAEVHSFSMIHWAIPGVATVHRMIRQLWQGMVQTE